MKRVVFSLKCSVIFCILMCYVMLLYIFVSKIHKNNIYWKNIKNVLNSMKAIRIWDVLWQSLKLFCEEVASWNCFHIKDTLKRVQGHLKRICPLCVGHHGIKLQEVREFFFIIIIMKICLTDNSFYINAHFLICN